ncbi:MAG: hypothetical protein DMG97_38450 [Acidobacteria bacterium]|nr:MAG: hypothetical protein DMG97_38450 [Acidobacteriota bacterium]
MSTANMQCTDKNDLASTAADLAELSTRMLTLSLNNAAEFMKQSSAFWMSAFSRFDLSKMGGCRCDIPEKDCPPRCVCKMNWKAARGERLNALIKVTNLSNQARNFVLVFLQSGESISVKAELTVTELFQVGTVYDSEVVITGAYEQCVCLTLCVDPESVCHCSVEQGDPPVRVRAHQWYDHFQCVEPCGPARTPNDRDH